MVLLSWDRGVGCCWATITCHCLHGPSPARKQGRAGCRYSRRAHKGVERYSARTQFRNVAPHQSFILTPSAGSCLEEQGLSLEEQGTVFWITSSWSLPGFASDGLPVDHALSSPPMLTGHGYLQDQLNLVSVSVAGQVNHSRSAHFSLQMVRSEQLLADT